jgi:hypothetical protein
VRKLRLICRYLLAAFTLQWECSCLPAIFYLNLNTHHLNIGPLAQQHNGTTTMSTKMTDHDQAFENTSTNVAASQMRNALNKLADTVKDPNEKKVSASRPRGHV